MALPPVITTMRRLENLGSTISEYRQTQSTLLAHAADVARQASKEGHTVSEIARAAGVTRPTIYQWLKEEQK